MDESDKKGDLSESEEKFLLAMYAQLWNNINRHVLLVWQPVTALAATLGLLSLVDKGVLGLDWATALAVVIASWLIAHTMDASAWFNRNQSMVANIEKKFLNEGMAAQIGPVVGKPRSSGRPILHFRIQSWLAWAVIALMLAHHFEDRVISSWHWFGTPDYTKWIPYLALIATAGMLTHVSRIASD